MKDKAGRNLNGEGSLFIVGDYWCYQLGYTVDGKHKQFKRMVGRHDTLTSTAAWKVAHKVRDEFFKQDRPEEGDKVTCGTLLHQYFCWLDVHRPKSAKNMRYQLQGALYDFFEPRIAKAIGTADIEAYQQSRKETGRQNASINREIAGLRAALRYEAKRKPSRISMGDIPFMQELPEDNVRKGFLDFDGYDKVLAQLPPSLRIAFIIAYHGGMRKSEVLKIKWTDVDFESGHIRLDETKNGTPRSLPFYYSLRPALEAHRRQTLMECPWSEYVCVWLDEDTLIAPFFDAGHGGRRSEVGDQIKSFYGSWNTAVKDAGFPELLFHDLRRSAVRNMVTVMKIPESQAMLISGHETTEMLGRYNIIVTKDLEIRP